MTMFFDPEIIFGAVRVGDAENVAANSMRAY